MTDTAFDYDDFGDTPVRVFTSARVFTGVGFTEPRDVVVDRGRIAAVVPAGEGMEAGVTVTGLDSGRAPDAGARNAGHGLAGRSVASVPVNGAYLMPGFTESHGHPVFYGLNKLSLNLKPGAIDGIGDMQRLIADAVASAAPGQWITGAGWDETYLAEKRMPTREDLDAVAPENPVFVDRTCGHIAVVNSAALAASGVSDDTPNPDGGRLVRDAAGRLTGVVQEDAKGLLKLPQSTAEDMERGFLLAQRDFHAWGMTTMNDCLASPDIMRLYQRLHDSGRLSVRMRPWLYAIPLSGNVGMMDAVIGAGVQSGFGDDMLRVQGVKFQLDGALGGKTAALCDPYEHMHSTGILTHPTERLTEAFRAAARGGLRMAIHAIGDAAIGQAFEALEASGELEWVKANRVRIEHCSLPTDEQLDTMVDWGLIASSSVGFIYDLGDSYPDAIGQERLNRLLPHRSYIDRGIVAPGNSDLPVTNGNPWEGVYGAVTRTTRTGTVLDTVQNISLAEALAMYTTSAAYANFEEDRAGVIAPGRFADFQVLDANPFEQQPEEWLEIRPSAVYVGGRQVV